MSDFDDVLEKLVTDPAFASALAADPDTALAGYRLDAAEAALLRSQVGGDTGGQTYVERRTNTSSTFAVLAPLVAMGGLAESFTPATGGGYSPASGGSGGGFMTTSAGLGARSDGFAASTGFGDAPGDGARPDGIVNAAAETGFGEAPARPTAGLGDAPRAGLGGPDERPPFVARAQEFAPPKGYHNEVDADGDGTWDRHTLRGRRDGGVDILVDLDGDGRIDFVGHDVDADRTVDHAEYDKDHDGVFDKRMYDDDGDGWLDRSVRLHP